MSSDNDKSRLATESTSRKNTINSPLRLASFTLPRDLTLGGSGPLKTQRGGSTAAAKKVFTPNLNVTRNKNVNIKISSDTGTRHKTKNEKSKTNQTRNRSNNNLIQTAGVFSEGVGFVRKVSASSSGFQRSDTDYEKLRKPTISKKDNKINSIVDNKTLENYLDDSDDDDDKLDYQNGLTRTPLKLMEYDNDLSSTNPKSVTSFNEIFCNNKLQLLLVQFPDSLPCKNSILQNNTDTENTDKKTNSNNDNATYLKDFEDGQIGKLYKYKSGKCKLKIGNTYFDLEFGMESRFLQKVVSIEANREQRSADIYNLGAITAKLTAIPDWERLFLSNNPTNS